MARPLWRLPRGTRLLLAGGGLMLAVLLADVLLRDSLQRLTDLLHDSWQRAQPRAATADPGVVVVDIDEASLARRGQWPWPRDEVAALVDALGQAGAAVVAFDMVFTEPDRTSLQALRARLQARGITLPQDLPAETLDNDLALAAAIARQPVVLGVAPNSESGGVLPLPLAGIAHAGSDPRQYLPAHPGGLANLPVLGQGASGMGSFAFTPDADNILRQMPLVSAAAGQLYPGLAVEALRVAQGAAGLQLRSSDASGEQAGGRPALSMLRVGVLEVPATADGRLYVHYSGMPAMTVLPAWQVLDDAAGLAARVEGRVVLVGTSAIGLRDIVATPLAPAVPGVHVHAELVDQMLNGQYLQRPDWARGAEIMLALLAGLLLLLALLPGRALLAAGMFAVLAVLLLWLGWWAYARQQWLLDPVPALLQLVVLFVALMPALLFAGNREKRQVRQAFSRYLAPALVQRLAEDPAALRLGGQVREVTVLFSDIRGFTALSESLPADALTDLLNRFLTPMTEVLLAREATIDKYIGDAIMAFWNAPLAIDGHPRKACLGALDMLDAVAALNAGRDQPLRIGIGLHTGPACVGNLGSEQRFSYSAIGDTVNLAARVEGLTKQYGVAVLVTGDVRAQAPDLAFLELDQVRVVGRRAPVTLYALVGDAAVAASAAFQARQALQARWLEAYRAGDFAAAATLLPAMARQATPAIDGLSGCYAERLAGLPPVAPAGWDGVFDAVSK